jgi:hypothetical protein
MAQRIESSSLDSSSATSHGVSMPSGLLATSAAIWINGRHFDESSWRRPPEKDEIRLKRGTHNDRWKAHTAVR